MSCRWLENDEKILSAAMVMNVYGGILVFLLGLIGNTLNIFVFTSSKVYRSLPTAAFLSAVSTFAQTYLTFHFLPSSLTERLGHVVVFEDRLICRIALIVPRIALFISFLCFCFSVVDCWSKNCRSTRFRHFITLKRARITICLCILICCFFGIVNVINANNDSSLDICLLRSTSNEINLYVNIVFPGLLPIFIFLLLGGCSTWKKRKIVTHRSGFDVHMTKMIFWHCIVFILSTIPFLIYYINRRLMGQLHVLTAVQMSVIYLGPLLSSTPFFGSFYLYLCVSSVFRRKIKKILFQIFAFQNKVSSSSL